MNLNPFIFREFSIRGIAEQDLVDEVVVLIGRAVGTFFLRRNGKSVVIGRDIRNSSARISQALISGLQQAKIQVIDIGVVPTPVHNFATDYYAAAGGVMVTASHNPPEYNGLKIRTDRTLTSDELQEIYGIVTALQSETSDSDTPLLSDSQGVERVDPLPIYLEHVKKHAHTRPLSFQNRPVRAVVDGGNGTNGGLVAQMLRDLGCEVIELYCDPDGNFPHRSPDPTARGATQALAQTVRQHHADVGLAYDGDGDRVILVDESGNTVLGDQIMMILARDVLTRGPAKIVYEILCTQALADDVIAHGGEPIMTPSGYAFVHQAILDTGAALGGELSGHLFLNEPAFHFDDAILATVKILNVLVRKQSLLSTLVAELPAYHSSPEIRLPCPEDAKSLIVRYIKAQFEKDHKVETLDGVRVHFNEGWALVRPSNTQPVISMRFEARSAQELERIQTRVQSLVEAEIKRLSVTKNYE